MQLQALSAAAVIIFDVAAAVTCLINYKNFSLYFLI
jgi:hypothetical protein